MRALPVCLLALAARAAAQQPNYFALALFPDAACTDARFEYVYPLASSFPLTPSGFAQVSACGSAAATVSLYAQYADTAPASSVSTAFACSDALLATTGLYSTLSCLYTASLASVPAYTYAPESGWYTLDFVDNAPPGHAAAYGCDIVAEGLTPTLAPSLAYFAVASVVAASGSTFALPADVSTASQQAAGQLFPVSIAVHCVAGFQLLTMSDGSQVTTPAAPSGCYQTQMLLYTVSCSNSQIEPIADNLVDFSYLPVLEVELNPESAYAGATCTAIFTARFFFGVGARPTPSFVGNCSGAVAAGGAVYYMGMTLAQKIIGFYEDPACTVLSGGVDAVALDVPNCYVATVRATGTRLPIRVTYPPYLNYPQFLSEYVPPAPPATPPPPSTALYPADNMQIYVLVVACIGAGMLLLLGFEVWFLTHAAARAPAAEALEAVPMMHASREGLSKLGVRI